MRRCHGVWLAAACWALAARGAVQRQRVPPAPQPARRRPFSPAFQELKRWVELSGGQVALEPTVGRDGLRGLAAARDVAAGEVVARIPFSLSIDLGGRELTASEMAVAYYRFQLRQPTLFAAFGPYWRTLPPLGGLYSKEVFREEHVAALQDPRMAQYVRLNTDWTRQVWAGRGWVPQERQFPSLRAAYPEAANITFEAFCNITAFVATYSFTYPDAAGRLTTYLLPVLDLLNHAGAPSLDVERDAASASFVATALRPLRKGEEARWTYYPMYERPDFALLNSFFVQERDPPLLCALDLPGGSLSGSYPASDEAFLPSDGPGAQAEMERLSAILVSFPTSAQEDRRLLANGSAGADWRLERVLRFRVLRKAALAAAIARLQALAPQYTEL